MADEPISSLDASAQAQIANLLAGIVAGSGLGMLFISHDLSVVRKIAHRTVVMYFGRIVESGAHRADLGRTRPPLHTRPHRRRPGAGRRLGAARPSSPATCPTRPGPHRAAGSTPAVPRGHGPLPDRGPAPRRGRARLAVALPAQQTPALSGRGGRPGGA